MKKTIFTLALLVITMMASAQTIKANYKAGDVRKYANKVDVTIGIPMKGELKASSEATMTITVDEANADGYVVDLKASDLKVTGSQEVIQQMGDNSYLQALTETPAKLKLDKNGAITDLINSDQVLSAMAKYAIDIVNKLYADHPEIEKEVPKTNALMAVNEQITKEKALESIRESPIFALNGKDLTANPTAERTAMGFLKLKSNYTVSQEDGQTVIKETSTSNMTEDDLKAFIKSQISKVTGSNVSDDEFNQQWGQLKMMGLGRLDANGDSNYTYGDGGWLTNGSNNTTMKVMGASTKIATSVVLQ